MIPAKYKLTLMRLESRVVNKLKEYHIMKKVILTIAIVLGIGFGAVAQSDAFFTQSFSEYRDAEASISSVTPRIPAHNLTTNQDAPLGTGLLLLAGMGLGYAAMKKKK